VNRSKVVLLLMVLAVLVSGYGCAAPLVAGASSALIKSTATAVGTGIYNTVQDNIDKGKADESISVPDSVLYKAGNATVKNAVLEVLSASGDTIDTATDTFIKTAKKTQTEEPEGITSLGRSETSVVKRITLVKEKGLVKVSLSVDTYRKTLFTGESKKEWPEYEQKIRRIFFEELSRKIKPAGKEK
jgi:hypothetical protein